MGIHKNVNTVVTFDKAVNVKAFKVENVPGGKVKLTAVFDFKPDTEVESIIPLGDMLGILFLKNNETINYPAQSLRTVCKDFGGNQIKLTFFVPSIKDYIPVRLATEAFQAAIVALMAR